MNEGILDGLNEAQLHAVKHDTGPALIVAGAGTGKTAVITRRISYLIKERGVAPTNILALTFTEKAAREMAERLYDLIGWESFQVPVLTFHGFGAELLGRYASHIGRSISGGLLNDMQKALLLQQHFDRVQLSYYVPQTNIYEFLEGVVRYIGVLQNTGVGAQSYRRYVDQLAQDPGDMHPKDVTEQQDLAVLYDLYEQIKTETGTYDYNDQLEIPLRIMQHQPNVAARLTKQYQYVLVDEYQDTNAIQDELLRAFVPPDGNMFAVGDDDQAIYGFRGAQIGNILSFVDHFKVKEPIALTENYRSGQEVLDAAYRLIQYNNPERLEAKLGLNKRLTAAAKPSATVTFVPYATVTDEQQSVLDEVERRLAGGEDPKTIGILAPTHNALRPIARGLRSRNLPFALSTQVNIFEQPELNQLWYVLEWLGYRATDQAISHVMMGCFVGWTAEQYRAALRQSQDDKQSIEDVVRASSEETAMALAMRLDEWRAWARELPVSQLAYRLVFETGVSDRLIKVGDKSGRIVRVFEDLHRLLGHMQDYETVAVDTTLTGYLASFPKPPTLEVAEPLGEAEGVQLLTIHASKGLEFETVYLIGTTQRNWSASSSRMGERDIPQALRVSQELPPEHELRRLMYVAVTRAKQELNISAATKTAGGTRQAVSAFVGELFDGLPKTDTVERGAAKLDITLRKIQRFYPLPGNIKATKLPFETSDGWIELGVSDLQRYEFCPYDFYLEKVLGITQPFGPQLAFGNAVHAAIQRYHEAKLRNDHIDENTMHAVIDEQWNDAGYETAAMAEQAKQLAHDSLHTFYVRAEKQDIKVEGVEVPITFELPEAKLRLRGRIDALFQVDNRVEIRDFKTGRSKTDPEKLAKDAKNSFQLRTYALAMQALTGSAPAQVTLDYVVTDTVGTAELSATILKNHRAKLIDLAERMRGRDFDPRNATMHQCASVRYYGTEDELDDLVSEPELTNA